jgi:uncharacterized protein
LNRDEILLATARFARRELSADSSGHDWWHVERVRNLALELARRESGELYTVELAALLHDISDYKLNGGDLAEGPRVAHEWLLEQGESEDLARTVAGIVAEVSFKGAGERSAPSTLEGAIVQDADRLDAIGAIGIARTFAYGGYAGQAMHDPDRKPEPHATQEEYLKRNGTTINHFHEKLLLLRDRMNTRTGRRLAAHRHQVLERFLDEFLTEWDALDLD